MSIICALKFNRYQAAIISDEEYWLLRRRKVHFCDNLTSLLTEKMSGELGMEVLYGSVGTPPFAYDVARQAKNFLIDRFVKGGKSSIETVEKVAEAVFNVAQKNFKRRIDTKLKSLYGFTRDDLNKGVFCSDGKKYEIKQEGIKKKAKELATLPPKGSPLENFLEHEGIILGYDKNAGISCYSFSLQEPVLYLTSGPFEIKGKGKDVGEISMAKYMNRKSMMQRRGGFELVEGTVELIKAAYEAALYNHEVGGYFNLIYLDGKKPSKRVWEIKGNIAKLATEVVVANIYNQIDNDITYNIIEKVIFNKKSFDEIEGDLFRQANSKEELDFILRGYKLDNLPDCFSNKKEKVFEKKQKEEGI